MGTAIMPTAAADSKTLINEALTKISSLATLPEVTAKIISTVEDPKSSVAQLHKIVAHDPALVTRILKVVNSAFYGLPGQVATVDRAIVMLGLNAVKNIALAASLGQMFRGQKLCDGFTAKDLWAHCVSVAVVARELAKQMKLPIAEEAFLSGMIHDIGILISLQTWPEQMRAACDRAKATGGDFCAIERDIIGVDHPALGRALAERWRFPTACLDVVGGHHQITSGTAANHQLIALVRVADILCCQTKHGFNLTANSQEIDPQWLASVELDPTVIANVRNSIDSVIEKSAALL